MQDNKSQHASILLEEELVVASSHLAKIVSLNNNRFETSRQAPVQVMEQNTIFRRHSFDDNGGGYEGL